MNEENVVREVSVDQPFDIDMEAMPGAGYMWELIQRPEAVELENKEVVSISKGFGGPSTQRFTLVAHQPGDYSLVFELKRRWERNPVKTSEIQIQAQ